MKSVKISIMFFLTIIVYVIFHITEEALGNFPIFMTNNWGIPDIGYARWLYHNIIFFLPVLLIAFMIFLINETKYYSFGLGISFWGVLNFLEHSFYTIKNLHISPGFYSALLFLVLGISTLYIAVKNNELTRKRIITAIFLSVIYWGISIVLVLFLASKVALIFF